MLSQSSISFPNPVSNELDKTDAPYLESEQILVLRTSAIGKRADIFETYVLKNLQHGRTIGKVYFYPPVDEEHDGDDAVDFDCQQFSELMGRYVPNVTELHIWYMRIKNLRLVAPGLQKLERLSFTDPCIEGEEWE